MATPLSAKTASTQPPRPRAGCLRTALSRLAIVGVGVMVSLCLVEIGVRLVAPQHLQYISAGLFEADPRRIYRLAANFTGTISTTEFTTEVHTDAQHLRESQDYGPKPEGTYRILVLGDSFTFAAQVPADQAYPKLLQSRLNEADPDHRYEVINAGVGGYGPEQEEIYLETEGLQLEPDLVIVSFFTENDMTDHVDPNVYVEDGRLYTHSEDSLKTQVLRPIHEWLQGNSHAYVFLTNRLNTLLWRLGLRDYWFPPAFMREYDAAMQASWAFAQDQLARLIDTAHAAGVQVVIVVIPTAYQADLNLWQQYLQIYALPEEAVDVEHPNRLVAEFAARHDVLLIDLLPSIRREAGPLYLPLDRHWNAAGHRHAADAIHAFLVEHADALGLPIGR